VTKFSRDYTVKSNARRDAKKACLDPASVVSFVKAGKTLYRFPLAAPKPAKAKAAPKPKAAKPAKTKAAAKPKAGQFNSNTDFIRSFDEKPAPEKPAATPKPAGERGLKFLAVAALLRREGGASITEVCAASGWLPHSARARISVDVTKMLNKGEEIVRRREDGVSHYAIVKSKQLELPVVDAA
jgi:uncharacterized protein DUF3489